jgi:hypothetical protein
MTSSKQTSDSRAVSRSDSTSESITRGQSRSVATTDQPGTKHTPFWEEDPEHWSLEEQRWRASELLMYQKIGHWFVRTSSTLGFGSTTLPNSFYVMPSQMRELTDQFYRRHNIELHEANRLQVERKSVIADSIAEALGQTPPADRSTSTSWNRARSLPKGVKGLAGTKRGPKPKVDEYSMLASVLTPFGAAWKEPENLLEICQKLDDKRLPPPWQWRNRKPPARTWTRQYQNDPHVLMEVVVYRCEAAGVTLR